MTEHANDNAERDEAQENSEDGWLEQRFPAVSADFVDRTLARVLRDRQQIEQEARQVEDIRFDTGLLANLQPPEPSADFVERTLARVIAQRNDRDSRDDALRELIRHYQVPQASPDFVPRTLSALGLDQVQPAPARARLLPMRRRAWRWAAAAVLLVGLPWMVASQWRDPPRDLPPADEPVAMRPVSYPAHRIFSTGRWGAAMADLSSRWKVEMPRIPLRDPEVTLAHLATHAAAGGR